MWLVVAAEPFQAERVVVVSRATAKEGRQALNERSKRLKIVGGTVFNHHPCIAAGTFLAAFHCHKVRHIAQFCTDGAVSLATGPDTTAVWSKTKRQNVEMEGLYVLREQRIKLANELLYHRSASR